MPRPENAFLLSLPAASFASLAQHLSPVALRLGEEVNRADDRVEWVYFPETCVISLISQDADGERVETSMVGSEGAAGLLEACGSGVGSLTAVVQVDGRAWRAPSEVCRTLVAGDPGFATQAWKALELQLAEARQSGLCQAAHPVERRFARWLLESSDRAAGRNPLPMTQEFIAAMLGVARTTVTSFAAQLQKTGLIDYRRREITIVDREGLQSRACECRDVTHHHRSRLGFLIVSRA